MKFFAARLTLALLLLAGIVDRADAAGKVTFEASSPLTVAVGETFRVEFTLNAEPDKESFKAPSFEGFDVLAGPSVSTGESLSIINGSMTKSFSYNITYVVLAQQAGNLTVGPAQITVDGTVYRTNPLPIEIVQENNDQGNRNTDRPQENEASNNAQRKIAKDDILLRTIVSRTSVFKGEPLRVTFKLYERVNVVGYDGVKFPSFNGFWAQELNTGNAPRRRETYNGKVYETLVARDYIRREKKSLVPTDKGLAVYGIVKDKKIADVAMTGGWELALAKIATAEMDAFTFHRGIEVYAAQIAKELLAVKMESSQERGGAVCPRCGKQVVFYPKVAKCQNADCGLTLWRTIARKELTDAQLADLMTKGKTSVIKGFTKSNGETFEAALTLDKEYKTVFDFAPRNKPKAGKGNKRK